MRERIIEDSLKLIPYYPNFDVTFLWYQDLELCKQVDNIDYAYTRERLEAMYHYLSTHGECYYIQYRGELVGDVSLYNANELAIIICKEYQNKHIGRKCIQEMISRAKEKGLTEVKANIYSFNLQSQMMFKAIGFKQIQEELFELKI